MKIRKYALIPCISTLLASCIVTADIPGERNPGTNAYSDGGSKQDAGGYDVGFSELHDSGTPGAGYGFPDSGLEHNPLDAGTDGEGRDSDAGSIDASVDAGSVEELDAGQLEPQPFVPDIHCLALFHFDNGLENSCNGNYTLLEDHETAMYPEGQFNQARSFNGSSYLVGERDPGNFNALTVEAWVKPEVQNGMIFHSAYSNLTGISYHGFALYLYATGVGFNLGVNGNLLAGAQEHYGVGGLNRSETRG